MGASNAPESHSPQTEGPDSPLVRALRKGALVYTVLVVLLLVLVLLPFRCSNPLPFGPGQRTPVTLDRATVRWVDHDVLFGAPRTSADQAPSRQALELRISSRTDLIEYFEEGDRQLQIRCDVVGNTNGKRYDSIGFGPYPDAGSEARGKAPADAIAHRYTFYAFVDLNAWDVQYEGGKPASTLDLKSSSFDALRCHLVGVTMVPLFWPRTNDLVVTEAQFRSLLREGDMR